MQLGFKSKYRYKVVDHRNGIRNFNCRACNLRVCSLAENARNRRYNCRERKTSIFRGVCSLVLCVIACVATRARQVKRIGA